MREIIMLLLLGILLYGLNEVRKALWEGDHDEV